METLARDVRFALRSLRRSPGFAALAILTLALGIGASAAVFGVVERVLLRDPPYGDPDRLALLWHRMERAGVERARISAPDVAEFRARSRAFEEFAFANGVADVVLEGGDRPTHVRVGRVSPEFFDALGVEALHGRVFRPGEARIPAEAPQDTAFLPPPSALILSHATWRARFGGDPGVVGRTVHLSGAPVIVIGVLPPEFEPWLPPEAGVPRDIDGWTPIRFALSEFRRAEGLRDQDSDNTGAVIGRLRPGASLARARAEMATIAARQRARLPFYREAGVRIEVEPLHEDAVRDVRPVLLAVSGAVGLLLLIGCLNVASLLLARGSTRRGEFAVRAALGAGRRRLARQALTESAVLAAIAGAVGIAVADRGMRLLHALGPAPLPAGAGSGVDAAVLTFALALTAGTVLAAGLPTAWAIARGTAPAGLREAALRIGRGGTSLRRGVVVAEVALSLVLLVGAGLLARSLAGLLRVDPGFEATGLVTFQVTLPGASVGGPAERAAFMRRLEDEVHRLPDVHEIGLTGGLPLSGVEWTQPYGPGDRPPAEWGRDDANFRVVTSGYFAAMGTRLLAGRGFRREEDLIEARRVVIVDRALAERVFPEGDAVGRTLGFPLDGAPIRATIVGVVENVRHSDLGRPGRETLYVPYRQEASRTVTVAVRADAPLAELEPRIRRIVEDLGPVPGRWYDRRNADVTVPAYRFRDMEAYVDDALAPTRFALALLTGFALLGLLLAVGGLYGVLSYAVSRRRREIGVRMALGARAADVVREVVGGGLRLAGLGIAIGLLLALVAGRVLRSLLFGVAPADPATLVGIAALLAAVAALASWLPARSAARVDPIIALRAD